MKKISRVFIALLALMLLCSTAMAADKVEISFCVGDSTLIINGAEVTVEKPYVVGEGVTPVPIRVITEAFGAEVGWDGGTKTVTLSYPDVEIVIQIDNPIAEVNGKAETLLAPPELTEAGYTMIPLRFISETFGAEVSYDAETARITVVKEKAEDESVSLEGTVNSKYIGDSYYGWSMENPVDMMMEYRCFDGMDTTFSDGDNTIYIEIFTYDKEDYNFENDYIETKMSLSDQTLVKDEKDTSDPNCLKMHFEAKSKTGYTDMQQFVTDKYIVLVTGMLSNDDAKVRDNYLNILSTFTCSFDGSNDELHDLSNIKDGYRRFEDGHLKLSFDVPADYADSNSQAENTFEFSKIGKGISSVKAAVYSKDENISAKSLAETDYEYNKKVLNEQITRFGDGVTGRQYDNFYAFEYTYTVDAETREYTRDVFFEVGDYVYNVSVTVELPNDDSVKIADRIINSVKAEPLDKAEIGVFMRNMPVATGTIDVKLGKMFAKFPNIYMTVSEDESSLSYLGPVNGLAVHMMRISASNMSLRDVRTMMDELVIGVKEEGGTVVKTTYETKIGREIFYAYLVKQTTDEENVGTTDYETIYTEQYVGLYDGYLYVITAVCPQRTYSENTKAELDEILTSIKFN